MTWEIALVGAYSTISLSFLYVSMNMGNNQTTDGERDERTGKRNIGHWLTRYFRYFFFLLTLATLLFLPHVGKHIVDAQGSDIPTAQADSLKSNFDTAFRVVFYLLIAFTALLLPMILWDAISWFGEKKRFDEIKFSRGDFS